MRDDLMAVVSDIGMLSEIVAMPSSPMVSS